MEIDNWYNLSILKVKARIDNVPNKLSSTFKLDVIILFFPSNMFDYPF